jgi:hypothetical protein
VMAEAAGMGGIWHGCTSERTHVWQVWGGACRCGNLAEAAGMGSCGQVRAGWADVGTCWQVWAGVPGVQVCAGVGRIWLVWQVQ